MGKLPERSGGDAAPVPFFVPCRLCWPVPGPLPRPGLVMTCPGRVQLGRRGWRVCVPAWVGAHPGFAMVSPCPGYPWFAPRAAYGRFASVPVVWDVRESCGAVRPARGAREGLFSWRTRRALRGYPCFAPRAAHRRFAALPVVWDVPGPSEASRSAQRARRGCVSPGALPCRWRRACPSWVPPGMAPFRPQGRAQAFCGFRGGLWDVRGQPGASGPARRGAGSVSPSLSRRRVLAFCSRPGVLGCPGAPRGRGVAVRAVRKTGPEGGFLPFLTGVFRAGGGRGRPRAGRFFAGPQKTDLCKKSARGCPATGCGVHAPGPVQ